MSMAINVRNYLDRTGIHYSVDRHPYTQTSMHTAESAHVPGDQLAKAVLLRDSHGYLLAVIPATHRVLLGALAEQFGRDFETASEAELVRVFSDCETGAVPALGPAYDLETVVDPGLCEQTDVYFESGDHEELVHLAGEDFAELLEDAEFMVCSMRWVH
ncbi:MAG: YbaK/EbsC family protein [Gammaproteobacteria bacterium]|nr:YbaK/EbsC family protein [Gammaproteobacteria bacterium]